MRCFLFQIAFKKSLFFMLDQPKRMSANLRTLPVSKAKGASNGSCNDAMTFLINDLLFYL